VLASALPPSAGGSETRGRAIFEKRCSGCHAPARLRGKGARVERDLSRIDRAMRTVGLLSEADVADLAAHLDGERDHEDGDHR
jgi:mono/diheme cytochrome c family protein